MEIKKAIIIPPPRLVKNNIRKIYYWLKNIQYKYFLIPYSKKNNITIIETDLSMYKILKKYDTDFLWASDIDLHQDFSHENIEKLTKEKMEYLLNSEESEKYTIWGVDIRNIIFISFYYSIRDSIILNSIIDSIISKFTKEVYILGKDKISYQINKISHIPILEKFNFPELFFKSSVYIYYFTKKYSILIASYFQSYFCKKIKNYKNYKIIFMEPELPSHRQYLYNILSQIINRDENLKNKSALLKWDKDNKYIFDEVDNIFHNEMDFVFVRQFIKILDKKIFQNQKIIKSHFLGEEQLFYRFSIKLIPIISRILNNLSSLKYSGFFSVDAWGPVYRFIYQWLTINYPEKHKFVYQHGLTINKSFAYWRMNFDHFFTFGDYDTNHLVSYWNYDTEKIIKIGNISTKTNSNELNINKAERNKNILIVTQYSGCAVSFYEDMEFRLGMQTLIENFPEFNFYVKHHPNPLENYDFFKSFIKIKNKNNVKISNKPIFELGKKCKCAVLLSSTSILEIIDTECVPVLFNPNRENSGLLIEKVDKRCAVYSINILKDLINKIMYDKIIFTSDDFIRIKRYYIENESESANVALQNALNLNN